MSNELSFSTICPLWVCQALCLSLAAFPPKNFQRRVLPLEFPGFKPDPQMLFASWISLITCLNYRGLCLMDFPDYIDYALIIEAFASSIPRALCPNHSAFCLINYPDCMPELWRLFPHEFFNLYSWVTEAFVSRILLHELWALLLHEFPGFMPDEL